MWIIVLQVDLWYASKFSACACKMFRGVLALVNKSWCGTLGDIHQADSRVIKSFYS